MQYLKTYIFSIFLILFLGCKNNEYNTNSVLNTRIKEPEKQVEIDDNQSSVGRAIWQKPGLVIERMGDISDKVIADIGAGTGYFSLKLAYKAQKVIAIEIDQSLLDFIDSTKLRLPEMYQAKIETRLALPNDPKIKENEVDIILVINTIAYIHNLPSYLANLKKTLKPGGKLMIIDYKMKRLPIQAPPKTERIYLDQLEELLLNGGYKQIQADDTSLDYQYIIEATKI